MSLDEIEQHFELKEKQFNQKLRDFQKQKLVPLTLKLILKHTVADYKFTTNDTKEEEKVESKVDFVPSESTPSETNTAADTGLEDEEAIVISEKKKIEDTLRQSMSNFMAKASKPESLVTPAINKRLGVGLAAVVGRKLAVSRLEDKQSSSDDGAESGSEEEEQDPTKFSNINDDDDSYYDSESDSDGSDHVGKGFDSDSDVDLTDFTEQDAEKEKLKALQIKLEKEYKAGFGKSKDPNVLINMKTMRLTFLNIGPSI